MNKDEIKAYINSGSTAVALVLGITMGGTFSSPEAINTLITYLTDPIFWSIPRWMVSGLVGFGFYTLYNTYRIHQTPKGKEEKRIEDAEQTKFKQRNEELKTWESGEERKELEDKISSLEQEKERAEIEAEKLLIAEKATRDEKISSLRESLGEANSTRDKYHQDLQKLSSDAIFIVQNRPLIDKVIKHTDLVNQIFINEEETTLHNNIRNNPELYRRVVAEDNFVNRCLNDNEFIQRILDDGATDLIENVLDDKEFIKTVLDDKEFIKSVNIRRDLVQPFLEEFNLEDSIEAQKG